MTRHFARKFQTLSVAARFVAIVAMLMLMLAAIASPAQQTDANQPSVKPSAVFVPQQSAASGTPTRENVPVRPQTRQAAFHPPDFGTLSFAAPVTYGTGGNIAQTDAVADLNGDGKPDIVVSSYYEPGNNSAPGVVGVLLGNGDGTFQPVVTYQSGGGPNYWVVIADVNGDGKPDIIVASCAMNPEDCGSEDGAVSVLLGNGDGTFKSAVTYDSGAREANAVFVADVNGDGIPDVVVTNHFGGSNGDGTVSVLLGNGDGTLKSAVTYDSGGGDANAVAVADVNGDGKPDLIVANYCAPGCATGSVAVLLGNGDGTFQPAVTYSSGAGTASGVVVGDVNNDGHPDLIVGNLSSGPGSVGVLLNSGNGEFEPVVSYDSGGGVNQPEVGDVNGDGNLDIIVPTNGDTVAVLLGNGDGTFQAAVQFSTGGAQSNTLAVADVNGDGKPDVIVAGGYANLVAVLLNTTGNSPTPTTTTLVSSPNPSVYSQSITFTATVSSSSGTPTGTVIFYDGPSALGSSTLAGGNATISVASLAAGSQSITAAYQGSGSFEPSTSHALNQVVNPATTTTSLVSSANPAHVNESVTYTATITSQYGGAATGMVTFQDNGATAATVGVSGNRAAYSTSYATEGTHSIVGTYSGDANNAGSTSPALTEKVDKAAKPPYPSTIVVTTSGSPSYIGQSVTFTATVTSAYGSIPNGETVTFYVGRKDDQTQIGTGTTSGGVATVATSSLPSGGDVITATYAGDATFKSSSGTFKQAVELYTTTTTIYSSENPACYHDPVTFTAIVQSNGGPTPTGQVFFTGIGYATLSGGRASAVKIAGTTWFPVIARYQGDGSNKAGHSATLRENVVDCN